MNQVQIFNKVLTMSYIGQCLWLSWLIGLFKHQRSAVRIQSLVTLFAFELYKKDEKGWIKNKLLFVTPFYCNTKYLYKNLMLVFFGRRGHADATRRWNVIKRTTRRRQIVFSNVTWSDTKKLNACERF